MMSLTTLLSKALSAVAPKLSRSWLDYAFLAAFSATAILPSTAFAQSYSGKIVIRDGDSFRPASSSTQLTLKAKIPTTDSYKTISAPVDHDGSFIMPIKLEDIVSSGARQADLFVPADVCVTSTEVDPQGAQTTYEFSLTYLKSDFDKKVDIMQFICLYKDQLWNPKLGYQGFTLTRRDKKTTSKGVVLLVPGFHNQNKEFGNMHEFLQSKGYTVYEFNYPCDQDIKQSSNLLMDAIYDVLPASVGPEKTNILAHSMGCLVARNFIETTVLPVKSFIMLAPPNFGSKQAWNICQGGPLKRGIYCNLEKFLRKYDVNAPAYSQLAIGSRYIIGETWQLYVPVAPQRDDLVRFNEKYKELPSLIIAGNDADLFHGAEFILPETKQGQGDGFVSICSANLPGIPMVIADGMTHATIKGTDEFNKPLDQSQYRGVLESIIHFLENHAILPRETRAKLNILLPDNTLDGALLLISDKQNNFVLSIDDKITDDDFFAFEDPEEELSKANQTVNYDPTSQMCTYFIYDQARIKDALRKKGKKPIFGMPSGVYNLCTFERSRNFFGFLPFVNDFSYSLIKNIGKVQIHPGRFVIYVCAENNFIGLSQFNDFSASLPTDEEDPSLETRVTPAGLPQPTQLPVETAVQVSASSSGSMAKDNLKVAFLEKGDKNNLIVSLLSYHKGWFSSGFVKKQLVTQNIAPVLPVVCGGKVVFVEKGIDDNIAIYDLKTGKISVVPGDGDEFSLSPSPDGRFVAYITRPHKDPDDLAVGISDLRTMQQKLIPHPYPDTMPTMQSPQIRWNSESERFVYSSMFLLVDDLALQTLVPGHLDDVSRYSSFFPVWSPDGKSIAFYEIDKKGNSITVWHYGFNQDASKDNVTKFNVPLLKVAGSSYVLHDWSDNGLLFERLDVKQQGYSKSITETVYLSRTPDKESTKLFTLAFPSKDLLVSDKFDRGQIMQSFFVSDHEILLRVRAPFCEFNDASLCDLADLFLYDIAAAKFTRLTDVSKELDIEKCLAPVNENIETIQQAAKPAVSEEEYKTPEDKYAKAQSCIHREEDFEKAALLLKQLHTDFPDNYDYLFWLAHAYSRICSAKPNESDYSKEYNQIMKYLGKARLLTCAGGKCTRVKNPYPRVSSEEYQKILFEEARNNFYMFLFWSKYGQDVDVLKTAYTYYNGLAETTSKDKYEQLYDKQIYQLMNVLSSLANITIFYERIESRTPQTLEELVPEYANQIPLDPWGNKIYYDPDARVVGSMGPDGEKGTADDISITFAKML